MASVAVGEGRPVRPSKRMWIALASSLIAVAFVMVANRHALVRFSVRSLGLNLHLGYTIDYVLPDGYRGVFSISEDPVNGVPPGTGDHGEVIYSIPESGHLVTTDTTPLYTWHKSEATYKSGRVIGIEGDQAEIRFRGLASSSDGKDRYLIGTNQQLNDWWSDRKDWFRIEKPDEDERREE